MTDPPRARRVRAAHLRRHRAGGAAVLVRHGRQGLAQARGLPAREGYLELLHQTRRAEAARLQGDRVALSKTVVQ